MSLAGSELLVLASNLWLARALLFAALFRFRSGLCLRGSLAGLRGLRALLTCHRIVLHTRGLGLVWIGHIVRHTAGESKLSQRVLRFLQFQRKGSFKCACVLTKHPSFVHSDVIDRSIEPHEIVASLV